MTALRGGARRLRRDIAAAGPFERFARAGYLARGVIFVLMGGPAVQPALGMPSDAPGQEGAMRLIADRPFGRLPPVLLAVGLAGYVALRIPHAAVNHGGRTAAEAQVVATLEVGGVVEDEAEQSVMFLSGGERETGAFLFRTDPATGVLTIEVVSFSDP